VSSVSILTYLTLQVSSWSVIFAIDTSTASGRFFFQVMASLAEMKRELAVEMTRAGLKVARLWYDLSSVDVWRFYDGCYIPYFVR
jgi:DNA invertase Pin-like site-specific DNA recombinase